MRVRLKSGILNLFVVLAASFGVLFLSLSMSAVHEPNLHVTSFADTSYDGHSHQHDGEFDDDVIDDKSSDHHHADHSHDKAGLAFVDTVLEPPYKPSFTIHLFNQFSGIRHGFDRPPRPSVRV